LTQLRGSSCRFFIIRSVISQEIQTNKHANPILWSFRVRCNLDFLCHSSCLIQLKCCKLQNEPKQLIGIVSTVLLSIKTIPRPNIIDSCYPSSVVRIFFAYCKAMVIKPVPFPSSAYSKKNLNSHMYCRLSADCNRVPRFKSQEDVQDSIFRVDFTCLVVLLISLIRFSYSKTGESVSEFISISKSNCSFMISNLSKRTMFFLRLRYLNCQDRCLLDKLDIVLSQGCVSVSSFAFNDIDLIMNDFQSVYSDIISTIIKYDVNGEAIVGLLN
jgi:hypothetical protein